MNGVDDLVAALDLERIERNIFRGRAPDDGRRRMFGGLVVAQALVAAARTVEGRGPHSLHAYFVLPGDPTVPVVYEVERVRDGRSFTTRRCVGVQDGRPIFDLFVSFQADERGLEHQMAPPDVPDPDTLPDQAGFAPSWRDVCRTSKHGSAQNARSRCGPAAWHATNLARRTRRARTCGSAPTAASPTIPPCTAPCWPTYPTSP